jgi:putative tryptophan/tyrosine transport system substrate-binding protein
MRRREFITLLGGAAVTLPLAARAQQAERVRRVGVLNGGDEGDQRSKSRFSWLVQDLAELGWIDGRNLHLDVRWSAGDLGRIRTSATELVDLKPEVIFVITPAATRALQQETKTIPIVFEGVGDPVAGGLLKNVSKPEGNATGVTNFITSMGGKWLELLKEAVPRVSRIALLFNPDISTGAYFATLEGAASQFAVTVVRTPYRDAADLVHAIDAFAAEPNGGLIVLPPAPIGSNRALINRLTTQHALPTIYQDRDYAAEGGLMSYGTITRDLVRRSASYVDRILRGAKPGELPVEFPTKFELVVNLKTAKAMGLTIPEGFLLRADELIE